MDDTAQKNQPSDTAVQKHAVSDSPQQSGVASPAGVSGTSHKESAPITLSPHEHLKPAPHEAMPEIPKEAASHMEISPNPVHPKISDEDKKLGAKVANESLAAPTVLSDDAVFPLSAQQVTASQTKEYSVWDSFKWYGKTVGRQMLRKIFLKKTS
ncbi:MAG: hypothetical protein RLZZ455_1150 [Candidatus Parcubacteria bacterium]|jgi:hypothetical protein